LVFGTAKRRRDFRPPPRQTSPGRSGCSEYIALYRYLQPGYNVYWNGFGDPPTLTYRADFDDMEFNRERQKSRKLIKGRFVGGNLGWIVPEDLELFACAFRKPLDSRRRLRRPGTVACGHKPTRSLRKSAAGGYCRQYAAPARPVLSLCAILAHPKTMDLRIFGCPC